MKSAYQQYYNTMKDMLKTKKGLLVCLAVVCALSYGFTIVNHSISVDNTGYHYYILQQGYIQQGRLTPYLLDMLIKTNLYKPYWVNAFSVIVLYFAVLSWCALFTIISKDKIKQNQLAIFASLFISYPIISELFICLPEIYPLQYFLCAITLILFYCSLTIKGNKIGLYCLQIICIFFGLSATCIFRTHLNTLSGALEHFDGNT
jgi:hypothetical protein